jgi:hypothetical protein
MAAKTINFPELENLADTVQRKTAALKTLPEDQLFHALLDVFGLLSTFSGITFKDALIVNR